MKKWFEKICIGLIFFLSALLLMFFGIRTAGKTIAFARAERIEVIKNQVDRSRHRGSPLFTTGGI